MALLDRTETNDGRGPGGHAVVMTTDDRFIIHTFVYSGDLLIGSLLQDGGMYRTIESWFESESFMGS